VIHIIDEQLIKSKRSPANVLEEFHHHSDAFERFGSGIHQVSLSEGSVCEGTLSAENKLSFLVDRSP
jgi:hypothetical protein